MVSDRVNRDGRSVIQSTHTRQIQLHRGQLVTRPPHYKRQTHLRLPHPPSRTGAQEFQHLPTSARSALLATLTDSIADQYDGIAPATHKKQVGWFDRWRRFLGGMGIKDEWIEGYTREQRTHLLSAFASACRRNTHGKTNKASLTGGTVKSTIAHVRATFRTHLRPDPALDANQKPSLFLQRQIAGYIDADTTPSQQKALPLSVFKRLYEDTFTPVDEVLGQLACGAFFFGMRSCEDLSVTGTRKTKRLKVRNIRFFKNCTEVRDKNSPILKYSDSVSITFEFQKNKQKNITVSQPRSGKEICPVIIWAKIVQRILQYKGSSENTSVNVFLISERIIYLKSSQMLKQIRHTVNNMSGLGFTGEEVGTHSIRASLAMALYLSKRAISTIMLLGRWSSDAFLLYVRRQVQEFSAGVSADMVSNETFFTIPDLDISDDADPRTRNSRSFANTISLNGPNASIVHAKRPAMHVWH